MGSAGKERLEEIMLHAMKHGEADTLKTYSLNPETWGRYKRKAKELLGEDFFTLLSIKEQYSPAELSLLSSGTRPTIHNTTQLDFKGEVLKFGILSDLHVGSIYTNPNNIIAAIAEMKKEQVEFIALPGDLTEGMMGRPGDVYELSHVGYKAQRDETIRILKYADGIKLYTISGNHDMSYNSKHGVGLNVIEDICNSLKNAEYLGHDEGDIKLPHCTIRLFHGGDGSQYALSYRGQKIIEAISGGEKPNVLIAAHSHKAISMFYRNIHFVEGGTLQYQSGWMRAKKLAAHVGFWIVTMSINKDGVAWFQPRWYPIYK